MPIDVNKTAMIHPTAGLCVSWNAQYVPKVVKHPLYNHFNKPVPYRSPRLVGDEDLYLAFLVKNPPNVGPLFGRLEEQLEDLIELVDNRMFALHGITAASWLRLEEALFDATFYLFRVKKDIPPFAFPPRPSDEGYLKRFRRREAALISARCSRNQFAVLAALLTMAIALHLDEEGDLGAAFLTLRTERSRMHHDTNAAWWDLLCESYVCDFNANLYVGAMIDPYLSNWIPHFRKFSQTRAPLWLLWGAEKLVMRPVNCAALEYFPPPIIINNARDRMLRATTITLPAYQFDPYTVSQAAPLVSVATNAMDTSGPEWDDCTYHVEASVADEPQFASHPTPGTAGVSAPTNQKALATLKDYLNKLAAF